MALLDPCPECGGERAAGICPRCLIRLGLDRPGLSLSAASGPGVAVPLAVKPTHAAVLETLAQSIGPVPRVLLRDSATPDGGSPVLRINSPEMPDASGRGARLQLFGEIARGGMGAVLKGRDNDLGRELAVKVLLERHSADVGLLRRFVEEAQIAGQLQHPGIVPVYELGTFADQRPYFAMKLVKGRTLAEVLAERSTAASDRPRLMAIFLDVAQTVAYAHARGVIHRDLKPSNIMVGSFGEVQVMDWGLAKVLPRGGAADDCEAGRVDVHETVIATARSGSDSDVDLSHAGSVLGTPSYMAPEQARGENEDLDERADVFALGSILCEILTGEPAFTGRSSGEILRRAARGDLADADRRLDACGADADLVAVTRAALAPEVFDRPPHAGAIVDGIIAHNSGVQERLRAAELAHAAESARAEEAKRTAEAAEARARAEVRARRLTASLAASILALAALGGGGYSWVRGQAAERSARLAAAIDDALDEAMQERAEAQSAPAGDLKLWGEAAAAARRAEELARQGTTDAPTRQRISEVMAAVTAGRAQSLAQADRVRVDRLLLAGLDAARGGRADHNDPKQTDADYASAFRSAGLDLDATDPAEAARWLAKRTEPVELAAFIDDWGRVRRMTNVGRPEADWRRLNAVARAADPNPWRDTLRAGIGAKGPDRLERLKQLADDEQTVVTQPPPSLILLAREIKAAGDPERAIAALRRAVRLHPADFWTRLELALALTLDPAIVSYSIVAMHPMAVEEVPHLTAAVALRPASSTAHERLATALDALKKSDEAEVEYREAIRLRSGNAMAHNNLADSFENQGKLAQAVVEYREAIRLDPQFIYYQGLGNTLLKDKKYEEAAAAFREVLLLNPGFQAAYTQMSLSLHAIKKRDQVLTTLREAVRLKPADAGGHKLLGLALAEHGDFDESIAESREAIRLKPDVAETHQSLADALRGRGDLDGAMVEYREAIRLKPDLLGSHLGLGVLLQDRGDPDRAVGEWREVLRINPRMSLAHSYLGLLLQHRGNLDEAVAEYREAIRLQPRSPVVQQRLDKALRLVSQSPRLVGVLAGSDRPVDPTETLEFAILCFYRKLYVASSRLAAEAFAADPKLATDWRQGDRYDAACAASRASSGQGEDNPKPDDAARTRLRRQALDWLKADLTIIAAQIESNNGNLAQNARLRLLHWKFDSDLAGVRDDAALAQLPQAERADWQALWAEVGNVLNRSRQPGAKP